MANTSDYTAMSVASLLKMREDIEKALSRRAIELKKELSELTNWKSAVKNGKTRKERKPRKAASRKVAPKFRSKADPNVVWSGRGVTPRWMSAEMKGTNLSKDSFRI